MKARLLFSILSLLLFAQCSTARTSDTAREKGATKTIVLDLPSFDAINASSGWNVIVRQGAKSSVRLEVSEKYVDRIKAEVRGGQLHLGMKSSRLGDISVFGQKSYLNAYITVADLKSVTCSGGVDMTFDTPIRHNGAFDVKMSGGADLEDLKLYCSVLRVDCSGGTDVEIDMMAAADVYVDASGGTDIDITGVNARECKVVSSGGSDVVMSGRTEVLTASCSGGSDFSASKLESKKCTISCSGAATAYVLVRETLNASASGGSDIYYYGNPKDVSRDTSSASSIKKRK